MSAGSGNIEAQQVEQSAAYQAYVKYKATQQAENKSSGYVYLNNENPAYEGKPAPVLETARDVLTKRDNEQIQNATQTNQSTTLKDQIPIETSSYIVPESKQPSTKPDYSEGTKAFNLSTEKDITFLQTAKESGVTNVDIYNDKGEKIGSTNPQDVTRARYDILKLEMSTGKPVKYSYNILTTPTQTKTTTQEDRRADLANLQGEAAKEVAPQEAVPFLSLSNPIKVNTISTKGDQSFATRGRGATGATTGQKESFVPIGESEGIIQPTSILDVVQFVPIGAGGIAAAKVAGSSIVDRAGTILKLQQGTKEIETALRENNLIIGTEKTANPKVIQVSQGTIGKSGIESFKPERAPIQVNKLPGGKVEATNPPPPPYLKETTQVKGIGKTGETKPTTLESTSNIIKTPAKGEVGADIQFNNVPREGIAASTYHQTPDKIFLNLNASPKVLNEQNIERIINHEVLHNTIVNTEDFAVSKALDIQTRNVVEGLEKLQIDRKSFMPLSSEEPETYTKPIFGEVTITKPTTVTLEPGLEGQAKVPITIIETTKKGSVSNKGDVLFVRAEPQESLPVDAVLVMFQGVSKEKQAAQAEFYGIKEAVGYKNAYYGKLTPELAEKLNYDIKNEVVITGTDLFKYKGSDFIKNKESIINIAREPEPYKIKITEVSAEVGEHTTIDEIFTIKSANAPEVPRPFVIRTIEAKGYTEPDLTKLPARQDILQTTSDNSLYPKQSIDVIKDRYPLAKSFEPSQIGTGEAPVLEIGKTNPEAPANISDLFTKPKQPENIKSNEVQNRKSNAKTETDFIFETLQFPAKTQTNNERLREATKSRTDIISINESSLQTKELNQGIFETINKQTIKEKQDQSMKDVFGLNTRQTIVQTTKEETTQATRQTTKQDTKLQEVFGFGGVPEVPTKKENPPVIIPILNYNPTSKKKKENKGKNSILFLGNVPQNNIIGMYNRDEIITNPKKIAKLTRQETKAEGNHGKFVIHHTTPIKLSSNKVSFVQPKKDKKKGFVF